MSSFFTIPGAQKKRKRASITDGPKKRVATPRFAGKGSSRTAKPASAAPASKGQTDDDESISGSGSESEDVVEEEAPEDSDSDSENEGETAAEKRLRLAERYLDNIRQEVDETGFDAVDIDRDIIAERLREDVAESKGKVYRKLADTLDFERASHTLFRSNNCSTTSVATCAPYAYTVTKDRCLIKWKLQDLPQYQWPQTTKKKPKKPPAPPKRQPEKVVIVKGNRSKAKDKNYQGHVDEILSVAASQDGKFVVTAGADRRLIVHDAKTLKPVKMFANGPNNHRDAVTGLAFRRGTNQLYSASKDRTVKVWSLDEGAYVETLFGHQDQVVDVDALTQERCISVGSRDRTARLWKVAEETQLVFRGGTVDKKHKPDLDPRSMAHEGSMDRIAMIDEELFVTGSDNGSIALWSIQKKKPLFVLPRAHGLDPPLPPTQASAEQVPDPKVVPPPQPRWITALCTVPYSDVILSGSWDGHVRVWKLSDDKRKIEPAGMLGEPLLPHELESTDVVMADADADDEPKVNGKVTESQASWSVKGVVNDISLFERGDRGKDGLCVVIGVGKEHRLGRWLKVAGGRNGAVVFEVPKLEPGRIGAEDEAKI
ncbi:WD40-repeat-containing domain protein [Pseudomassariella vexata]|uniref:WD40-repeat-containing domain protein n=1 Tax=Pseudomassariella vexata TaxID=1141098 RepID=A0A1Y2EL58_9PEZI|nr:WD40-repeat-containing domain protein [Pseudomassariella vexata]ORY72024.1 WD40-repeat-containing domain protein [Pseudomassariella vexata]